MGTRLSARPPAAPRRTPWRLIALAAQRLTECHGSMLAAAISFYLLLSLAPLILIALSAFGFLLDWRPDLLMRLQEQIVAMLPTKAEFVQELVRDVVRQRTALGGFGLLALVGTASQGLATVSQAINIVWGTPYRSFLHRRFFGLQMLLTLGGLFLCSTVGGMALQWLSQRPYLDRAGEVWKWLQWAVIPLLSVTLFSLTYRWAPTARKPSWPCAITAGTLAGLAWEFAKTPFTIYLTRLDQVGVVPASLGTFLGLALWGYYSGMVLLAGAALASAATAKQEQPAVAPEPPVPEVATEADPQPAPELDAEPAANPPDRASVPSPESEPEPARDSRCD